MKTETDVQEEKLATTTEAILKTLKESGNVEDLEKSYDETKQSLAKVQKEMITLKFNLVEQK